jgi:hypothetical protein
VGEFLVSRTFLFWTNFNGEKCADGSRPLWSAAPQLHYGSTWLAGDICHLVLGIDITGKMVLTSNRRQLHGRQGCV